jgi:hypothetical protein
MPGVEGVMRNAGFGDPKRDRGVPLRRPQYDKEKLQRLLIEYPDARMFLANKVRNPNFKKADFDIVLKKLGLK